MLLLALLIAGALSQNLYEEPSSTFVDVTDANFEETLVSSCHCQPYCDEYHVTSQKKEEILCNSCY